MAWAELSDVRCYYETLGSGDPLLLIPGLGCTGRSYDPVLGDFAAHFSVVLPDNRGVGQSVPRRAALSVADLAADLVELLDYLQVERAHVLGLSFGGVVAQRLAVDFPDRVDRLVLVSCADRFTPYLRQIAQLLGQLLRHLPRRDYQRAVELLGTAPLHLDGHAEQSEARARSKARAGAKRGELARQLRCLACSPMEDDRYVISAPTLVIAGEHDVLIPSPYARRMADRIPGSRFHLVRGAGHNPFEECPERVLPEIVGFLRRQRPCGAGRGPGAPSLASKEGGDPDCEPSRGSADSWRARSRRPAGAGGPARDARGRTDPKDRAYDPIDHGDSTLVDPS